MTTNNRSVSARKNRRITLPPARWQLLLLAILVISLGSQALAQTAPAGTYDPSHPYIYPAPPAGFNPLVASDADLKTYGFPPRLAPATAGYAHWAKAVAADKTRLVDVTAEQTGMRHSPLTGASAAPAVDTYTYANNCTPGVNCVTNNPNCIPTVNCDEGWSGVAVEAVTPNYFQANGSYVYTDFNVPAIGPENCQYAPYSAAMWEGLDGLGAGNNDILQAGVIAQPCQGLNQTTTNYWAVYQWWTADCECGYLTLRVNSGPLQGQYFSLSPGDGVAVTVWYTTTAPNGNVYIVDMTSGNSASIAFNNPSTTYPYKGTSAEWILERAQDGSEGDAIIYENLANYGSAVMVGDYNGYLPGAGPGVGPPLTIDMYCGVTTNGYADWTPFSACPGYPWVMSGVGYNQSGGVISFQAASPASTQ